VSAEHQIVEVDPLSSKIIETLPENVQVDPITLKFIYFFVLVTVILIFLHYLKWFLNKRIPDVDARHSFRKFISFLRVLTIIVSAVVIFGYQIEGLNVFFGIAGAGIAFAMQEFIVSFIAWFAITFNKYYRAGDRVQIAGIKGDVIDVDFLKTTVMELGDWVEGDLYNGRIVKITNNQIFKAPVYNYNSHYPFIWDEINVPVKYGSNIKECKKLFEEATLRVVEDYTERAKTAWNNVTRRYLIEKATIEPLITISAHESWVVFKIRYIVDYKARRTTQSAIWEEILTEIELKDDIFIASTTLDITSLPELHVKHEA
jgi:small-conductance mechanosensitive channel